MESRFRFSNVIYQTKNRDIGLTEDKEVEVGLDNVITVHNP